MEPNLINKKGIIFDCDGVLIDSKQANIYFYNLILQALSLPPLTEEMEQFVHSHAVGDSIRRIVPSSRLDEAMQAVQEISYHRVLKYIQLHRGVLEFLQNLQQENINCAVNTNRTNTIDLVLNNFGLSKFFSPVITPLQLTYPKPHPEGLHKILHIWNYKADQVVFIGDSKVDADTAAAAGVEFWAFKNNSLQASLHIPDFHFLQDWFLVN